ncbi:hypothetical protein ACFWSJ_22855 [Streptomyces niveus]
MVTTAGWAPGSSRIASRTAVHDVHATSSAPTNEDGQLGIIWCFASSVP